MEQTLILQTTTAMIAMLAAGGLLMAGIRFSGRPHAPSWLAMGHGFLATAALTLLIYAAFTVGLPLLAQVALALFLMATCGGVLLNLGFHLKGVPLPKWLVVGHGALAIAGFLLLLSATWTASHA